MKHRLAIGGLILSGSLVVGMVRSADARFHSSIGVVIGPGMWGPGYYDPYFDPYYGYPYYGYYADPYPYDRYYYPYGYAPRYVPVPVAKEQSQTASKPDDSRHDLTFLEGQIERARDQIHYDYDDGDISKDQRKAALHRLKEILEEARALAKANGGFITGDQQADLINELHGGERVQHSTTQAAPSPTLSSPVSSDVPLKSITDRVARLRGLLDKKVSEGAITRSQRDGMATYLDRTEAQAKAQAAARGGTLARDQEEAARQQLDRAEDAIRQNLVVK